MRKNAGMMQPYVNWLRAVSKTLKATGVWDDPGRCKVLVWDRKLKYARACKNRRCDGRCCEIHSTALDCGDDLVYTTSGRKAILAWMKAHGHGGA